MKKKQINKVLNKIYMYLFHIISFDGDLVNFNIPKILQKIRSGSPENAKWVTSDPRVACLTSLLYKHQNKHRAEIRMKNRMQAGIIVNIRSPISSSSKNRKDIDHSGKKLCSPF
jgi:hypothetical protein